MHLPLKHFHIVSSPQILKEVAKASRWDADGLFLDSNDKQLIFFPLIKDLVGEIDREEFLFTCHKPNVARLRNPILAFTDARNAASLKKEIKEVIQATLYELEQREQEGEVQCSAQEISSTFTVAVISKLLLGRSPSFAENKVITEAITICLKHSLMTFLWGRAGKDLQSEYEKAIGVLQRTVSVAQGPFLDSLKTAGMNEKEIQTMFYLMYFAGAENSSSLLQYMLWQVGQNKECQTQIFQEVAQTDQATSSELRPLSRKTERVFNECFRLHPPVSFFGRNPRFDLEIQVKNKTHPSWSYHVPKGQDLICAPYLAARNSDIYPDPDTFNPDRENIDSLAWKPFGSGMHACPGRWLAEKEIQSFAEALIERYEINSGPNKLAQKGFVLLHLEPSIQLTLKRRQGLDMNFKV
jgi:cytochrome P450